MAQKATIDAINTMVVGLKADGVWDKITEAYLMAGVNFDGITVKLKERDALGEIYASDFSAGTDGWSAANGTGAGNIDGIGGQDDNYRYTVDTSANSHTFIKNFLTSGSEYTVSLDVFIPSTNADLVGFRYGDDNSVIGRADPTLDTWVTVTFSHTFTTTFLKIGCENSANSQNFTGNGTDVMYVRNVTVTETKAPSLTNNNFVTGDYSATGTGAGLAGDGSTKYLDTGLNDNTLSADDKSFGAYVTVDPLTSNRCVIGRGGDRMEITINPGASLFVPSPNSDAPIFVSQANTDGHIIGSRRGVNDVEAYRNGVSIATDTSTASDTNEDLNWEIFTRGGGGGFYSDATLTFAHVGTGLTDTEASNLSLRVNKLMYDLGCETYVDQGILDAMTLDADAKTYAEAVLTAGGNFEGA